jgi:pimeloyl-ACP methyl ester carboxylesterase
VLTRRSKAVPVRRWSSAQRVAAWKETMAFDSRRRLAEIACPTLVVAGADDRAVPIHHAQELHVGIGDSQLSVIAGAGHTLIWAHSDEFVKVTEQFLLGSDVSGDDVVVGC